MTRRGDAAELTTLLAGCRRAVVFTGAGISTESGIPDFRGPGGFWTKYKPIQFQDFIASEDARRESWRMKFETEELLGQAEPNRGHIAVAELVDRGIVSAVITQNIDGLHQAAGVPADKVIELHGSTRRATCLDCGRPYSLDEVRAVFLPDETVPYCDDCGGAVKTATISFGQAMPEEPMRLALVESLACDLMIVLGSSLVVFPAADFPRQARDNGADLVIVNREPTPLDLAATIVINDELGAVIEAAVAGLDG